MLSLIAPISSLLSGVALLLLGNGLLNTLLTLRGVAEGYSSGMLGLVMSGYVVGFLLGSWVSVPLIRRTGHIRAFAFCAALATSCALLHAVFVDPWVWLLRVLYGIGLVTLYTVIESWLNAQRPNEQRGQVFALYMAVNLGALAVAQQLIGIGSITSFMLFAVAAILICVALMPITLTRQAQPTLPETPKADLLRLRRIAPLPMAASGLAGLAMGAFWGLAPVYASRIGLEQNGIGLLMSLTILGGALLQWPVGRFSDRLDRHAVLTWVLLGCIGLSLLIALLPPGPVLLCGFFLWGGLAFAIYPIAVAQLIDQLPPDEVLAGSSGLLLVNGSGSIGGPLLAGVLMGAFGPKALPLYFAAILGLLAVYARYRRQRVCDLLSEPRGHFTPMLRTSHTVLELMPDTPPTEEAPQTR